MKYFYIKQSIPEIGTNWLNSLFLLKNSKIVNRDHIEKRTFKSENGIMAVGYLLHMGIEQVDSLKKNHIFWKGFGRNGFTVFSK